MNKTPYNHIPVTVCLMPFVPVPKDLTKVKTKVAFNLTKRQLICFGLAAVVGIPTYIFSHGAIGNDAAVMLMIGLMLPFFFFAMYEKEGQPAERIMRNLLRTKLYPGIRPYRTRNLYNYLQKKEGKTIASQNKAAGAAAKAPAKKRPAGKAG